METERTLPVTWKVKAFIPGHIPIALSHMGTELTLLVSWEVKVFVHGHLPIFSHMGAELTLPVSWEVKCFCSLKTFLRNCGTFHVVCHLSFR